MITMFLNIEIINDGNSNYSITGSAAIITFSICGFYIISSILTVLKNINHADKGIFQL